LTLWRGLLAQERTRQEPDKGRIAELDDRIQAQQGALSRLENQLAESDPKFYEVLNVQASVMSAEEVCAHLEKDTALIEYAFLGDDLLAWGLSQTGILKLHREALDAKALARDIRKFHQVCKDRQEVDILGATLSQILLSPLADIIRKHRHLIFVPYGPAHALPFHALPFEGEPLGVSRVISYLPSASTLQFVKPELSSKTRDRILSIGNPTAMAHRNPLTGEKFPARALPAAAAEAAFTAALFPQGKALIGGQATEQEVRRLLPDYPLIHFATHGVLSEENPLLSSILLADGEALSVYELMGMQLSADLVVLSACQTGLGRITGGDDVIGLTRGLLAAGARSTVVSLWPVDDLSTSLFMGEFYRRLRAGGRSADCLQAAQNYIRSLDAEAIAAESARLREAGFARHLMSAQAATPTQDYRHPYFWAPFVLVG
jgi:CHAT domain-containing protein